MHPLSLCRKIKFSYLHALIFLSKRRRLFLIIIASFLCVFVCSTLFILNLLSTPKERSSSLRCFERDFGYLPTDIPSSRIPATHQHSILFGGNGHLGVTSLPENIFFWNYSLSKVLNSVLYIPDVKSNCPEVSSGSDHRDGILYIYRCCILDKASFPFKYELYAHRTRPSILVQKFDISSGKIDLTRKVTSGKHENQIFSRRVQLNPASQTSPERNSTSLTYILNVSTIIISHDMKSANVEVAVFAAAYPEPSSVSISALNGKHSISFIYGLRLSPPRSISSSQLPLFISPNSSFHLDARDFGESLLKDLLSALGVPENRLRDQHVAAWNKLWNAGLSISRSIVPRVPNTENIMRVFYALLCSTPSGTQDISWTESLPVEQKIKYCYSGPYTLEELELWLPISAFTDLLNRINSWKYILSKYGCRRLLESGPESALQAILRSTGAIMVTEDHLSLVAPLHQLHRELSYRGLELSTPGISVSVNLRFISHEVSAQPQLELSVQLSKSNANHSPAVFACSAGCLSSPLKLGFARTKIPIFHTNPQSPILYIATDSTDVLIRISKQQNFNELLESSALRHDLLALHEHGTSFGGLPIMFWFLFILLLFVFHLLLVRIVCSELLNAARSDSRQGYTKRRILATTSTSSERFRINFDNV